MYASKIENFSKCMQIQFYQIKKQPTQIRSKNCKHSTNKEIMEQSFTFKKRNKKLFFCFICKHDCLELRNECIICHYLFSQINDLKIIFYKKKNFKDYNKGK